ncbi:MAG: peptidyl-prolyl cis-trans isomerase [Myxococcales bacterium]|nr:peptidyl-prolyl cis-trans isomerase [Myxococcales bacterium]
MTVRPATTLFARRLPMKPPMRQQPFSPNLLLPAVLVVSAILASCARPERPHPAGPGQTPAAAAAKVENVPAPPRTEGSKLSAEQAAVIVATIGARQITLGELEQRLLAEPAVIRSQFASVQKRKDYLQKMVQFEVLAAEARRQGLDRDPEVLEITRQALVRRWLATVGDAEIKPATIPAADLRSYYDQNPQLYHKPEQVDVSHMLFANRAKADKVRLELIAGSAGNTAQLVSLWNDYVVRLSEDKDTAPQLGALGLVARAAPHGAAPAEVARLAVIPPELIEAAFALKAFEVGPVVATARGFHVVMVTSRSPAVEKTFDEVKDSIAQRVAKRERELLRQRRLDDLRAKAKIDVNDDVVRLIEIEAAAGSKGPKLVPADPAHVGHGQPGQDHGAESGSPQEAQ